MPTNKVLVFSEKVKGWVSFRSHIDMQNGISMGNDYYTFAAAKLWKHYEEGTVAIPHPRNTFYGPYPEYFTPTSLTAILNDAPGSVKSFNTINYEGSQSRVVQNLQDNEYYNLTSKNGWYIDSIFTDKEQGTIDEFIEKEGKWFNYIKGKEVQHFISESSSNPFTGIVSNDNGTSSLEQGSFAVQGIGTLLTYTSVLYSGCTDPTAFNYQPTAVVDDGSCTPYVYGCMIASASNYNQLANTATINHCQWIGCADATAFNHTSFPPEAYAYGFPPNSGINITDDGSCIAVVFGCIDNTQFNYNPLANTNDGSCIPFVYGCMDDTQFNYNPLANTNDNSCVGYVYGCNIPGMCNYDPAVNTDDGSCVDPTLPPTTECYQTATLNAACVWITTGTPATPVITANPISGSSCTGIVALSLSTVAGQSWSSLEWYFNNQLVTGATGTSLDALSSGSYKLRAIGGYTGSTCQEYSNSINVTIGALIPTNLSTSNIGLTSATFNWGSVSNAHHYDIRWRVQGSSTWLTQNNIQYSTSITKTTLIASSTYEWEVRSACSSGTSSASSWSVTQNFTTATPCVVPTTPVTTGITTMTATLGWNAVSGAWGYSVRYKKTTQPWAQWTYVVVNTNSYDLTALLSGTAYHWQVASMCDANGSNSSAYTGYTVFTTTQ